MTSLALALRPTAAAMARSQISRALALLRSSKAVYWRDPSDLSTLFQDSAGTTPVTAVEQPVGLMLDKRTAGQPGPELVTHGSNETALFNFGTISSADTLARAAAPGGGFAASATSTTSTSTAHRLQDLSALLQGGKTYRIRGRYYVPTGGVATFRVFDNTDGSWFGVSSTMKDQWGAFSVIRAKATNWNLAIGDHVAGVVTSGQIAYWIDDLSITEIPGVHFVQATPASRPILKQDANGCYYLNYDGIDDYQASAATVDLTGTDKITVVGAWHKASDTSVGALFETSADSSANSGAFGYFANGALVGTDAGTLGGTGRSFPTAAIAPPATSVLSLVGNIATDAAIIRRNGVQVGTSAADQGTGNYGNFTMFVGSRGGVSFRFNGREYGHALFNTTLTTAEIAALEAYFRAKSRAY